MNLQAKLTLWYVLLVVVLVGSISGVDLASNMQQRFDATLAQADTLKVVASKFVTKTLNSQPSVKLSVALQNPELANDLTGLLRSNAILEFAVFNPQTKEILADSSPDHVGDQAVGYPDFQKLVVESPWYEKWKVLKGGDISEALRQMQQRR